MRARGRCTHRGGHGVACHPQRCLPCCVPNRPQEKGDKSEAVKQEAQDCQPAPPGSLLEKLLRIPDLGKQEEPSGGLSAPRADEAGWTQENKVSGSARSREVRGGSS